MASKRIEIEVSFSLVRRLPCFKKMTSGAIGAFYLLANAAILDGKYPLPESVTVLARMAHCTRLNWYRFRDEVLAALDIALPILFDRYEKEKAGQRMRSDRTRKNCANWHKKLQSGIMRGKQGILTKQGAEEANSKPLPKNEAIMLVASSVSPNIIQPTFATKYRSQRCDMHTRQLAKSNKKPPAILHD